MDIERTRVTQVGLTQRDVAQNVLVSLSGSFQTSPNFWLNPRESGQLQVAVQAPQYRDDSTAGPDEHPRDLAAGSTVDRQSGAARAWVRPCTVNHYNVQPVIDVYASTQDRDLGAVAADTDKILKDYEKHLPRGTHISCAARLRPCALPSSGWALDYWARLCWCTC